MTEQDAEQLFIRVNAILRDHGLTWLAIEIAAEAAEGRASPKMVAIQERFGPDLVDEIHKGPARRKTEFTHVRPLTSKEKMDVSIKALRAIVVSSGKMLPEILGVLGTPHSANISFLSETDLPPTILSQSDSVRFSEAAVSLDKELEALSNEIRHGS